MSDLTHSITPKQTRLSTVFAIVIALLAIAIAILALVRSGDRSFVAEHMPLPSTIEKIREDSVINVGFGVWRPYTQLDEELNDPTGLSVDLIKEIASRAGLDVKFHKFNWDTLKPDLMRGKWDVAIEPVFVTMPRSLDFGFTEPYGQFGIACAIVRVDEQRFGSFRDLDRSDITIALAEGWTSSEYAKAQLAKPTFSMVSLQQDNFAQLNEVLLGRADVALNDAPTVFQFAQEHAGKVKALWLETPPSIVVGGMLTRSSDVELLNFLNNSLRTLKADGTLKRLDEKWKPIAYYEKHSVEAGAGIKGNQE